MHMNDNLANLGLLEEAYGVTENLKFSDFNDSHFSRFWTFFELEIYDHLYQTDLNRDFCKL